MSNRLSSPRADEMLIDNSGRMARIWFAVVSRVTAVLGGREPLQLYERTVATLPDATKWRGCQIAVSDEVGGYCTAVSDGMIWRRSYDNAEVES
jgi:hypothetical protein